MKNVSPLVVLIVSTFLFSCKEAKRFPADNAIAAINLKKGNVVLCGPADRQFGDVQFATSCRDSQEDFNLALALLHSFEYDEAEKVFAKIIDEAPGCAMAYWGVAMSNYHPLWAPPSVPELEKGAKAIAIAQSVKNKTPRESAYVNAIASFYKDWNSVDHHTRAVRFEKAMEKVHADYADDKDAAIFYALSLDASADPGDKTFANQKKAGAILTELYPGEPNHPGIVHYIIHSYDYPELASLALPSARKYASIAPSSAHAQHMPSHIFTRLGLWDECITSNLAATSSAKCYAEAAGIKGHWDEEVHGMDYLVYAYLQKGENELAKKQVDYIATFENVSPVNFKVAYAFASIPSRYALENKMWKEAASLHPHPDFPWQQFPWENSIVHFARFLGNIHTGKTDSAMVELAELKRNFSELQKRKETYKANQVNIQLKASEAWLQFKKGNEQQALSLMKQSAAMEDATEKHPVTPGEVVPARELLGEMLLQMNKPQEALIEYEANLKKHPNRFNGLYGAAVAAEKSHDMEKARNYYRQLLNIAGPAKPSRKEIEAARSKLTVDG